MLDSPDAVHVIDPTTAPDELDFDLPHFVGIDGEAVTGADGEHRYVLLCSSEGDRLWRESGISTSECLAGSASASSTIPARSSWRSGSATT
jgi:hypothetical protein